MIRRFINFFFLLILFTGSLAASDYSGFRAVYYSFVFVPILTAISVVVYSRIKIKIVLLLSFCLLVFGSLLLWLVISESAINDYYYVSAAPILTALLLPVITYFKKSGDLDHDLDGLKKQAELARKLAQTNSSLNKVSPDKERETTADK